jgi:hypothetical protein
MIDLSCWNWTGPKIDPRTKKLFRLETKELIAAAAEREGVADQLFFGSDEYGDFMEYIAPSGAGDSGSTENSSYPRSELRQTLPNGDDKEANWRPDTQPQSLFAKLRVMSLAKSKKAILGQIHGDGNHPPFKEQVTGDILYGQFRKKLNGSEDKIPLGKFTIGEPFTYQVDMHDDWTMDVYFNGKLVVSGYQFDATSYANDTWYWKAGMYSQEDAKTGSGIGRVRFYELSVRSLAVSAPSPIPTIPAKRAISDLAREVSEAVSRFKSGDITSQDALAEVQERKVEADTQFIKSAERSALYAQITAARETIRKPVTPIPVTPAPVTPAEPEVVDDVEAIKSKLSDMEDLLDAIPDATAKPLRTLIDDLRRLVA